MIDRRLDFLRGREPATAANADELELAVVALLIEEARMERNFDASERAAIARGRQLVDQDGPGRRLNNQRNIMGFTRQINDRLSGEERIQIIEMLWKVAYADGALDPCEDMLLRRIVGLIDVTDLDRGLTRRRALEDLALDQRPPGAAG